MDATWLPSAVTSAIALGALGFVWYDMKSSKTKMTNDLKESKKQMADDLKKSLYHDSGITKYVPRGECDKATMNCQKLLCSKIDDLKLALERESKTNREFVERLAQHVGRVEQYIKDHR